jgi:hypothetical protein
MGIINRSFWFGLITLIVLARIAVCRHLANISLAQLRGLLEVLRDGVIAVGILDSSVLEELSHL